MNSRLRQFELLEDLRPGRTAKAVLLKWNGHEYVRTKEQIVLYEYFGLEGDQGDRGYACLSDESNRWEVISGLVDKAVLWLPT